MPNRKDWQPEDTQVETAAMALRAQQMRLWNLVEDSATVGRCWQQTPVWLRCEYRQMASAMLRAVHSHSPDSIRDKRPPSVRQLSEKGYREWGGCGFCRNPVAARSRWFARASRFLVFSIVAVDGMCHSSGVILAHKDSGPLPVPDVICVRSSRVFSSGRLCLTGGRLGVACPFGGVGRTVLCPR